MILKKGIEKAVDKVVAYIKSNSEKIKGKEDMEFVAAISSGDETIGKLIADAMEKVTRDGVITIEESRQPKPSLIWLKACSSTGYISAYMVTDSEKMEAVLDDPYILITDKKISNVHELLPALEKVAQRGGRLL